MYSSQRSQAFELANTTERQRGWGTGLRNALAETTTTTTRIAFVLSREATSVDKNGISWYTLNDNFVCCTVLNASDP